MTILPAPATATTAESAVPLEARRSRLVVKRLLASTGARVGVTVIAVLFAFAFLFPLVSPYSTSDMDYESLSQPPSVAHPFGTNNLGQDICVRVASGLQKSLLIGVLVAVFSAIIAGFLGAIAGYFGGWIERIVILFIDLLLTLPSFLFIAILSPKLRGFGWFALVVVIAAFGWMITARIVRSMTLSLRDLEYVRAARYMGISHLRIIFRHVLPQMMSFIIVDATIAAGAAVMTETGLSYFGFGIQAPEVSIGNIISSGQDGAFSSPWLWIFALGALVIFVLATNLVGDGLRDALDPTANVRTKRPRPRRQRKAHPSAGARKVAARS